MHVPSAQILIVSLLALLPLLAGLAPLALIDSVLSPGVNDNDREESTQASVPRNHGLTLPQTADVSMPGFSMRASSLVESGESRTVIMVINRNRPAMGDSLPLMVITNVFRMVTGWLYRPSLCTSRCIGRTVTVGIRN